MPQTITAANTTTDPTTSPSVTAVADNDIGNAANLDAPIQPILNFIAWLRSKCALLNMGGARLTNLGAPTTAGDATVYPLTNAQQNFGTPGASTDVATKGYTDGKVTPLLVARVNGDGSIPYQKGSVTASLAGHSSTGQYGISIPGITTGAVVQATGFGIYTLVLTTSVSIAGTLTVYVNNYSGGAAIDQPFIITVYAL